MQEVIKKAINLASGKDSKMLLQKTRRFIRSREKTATTGSSYKDVAVLLPLLLTTGALTFDVGYFNGVDINLFTLFSLSEHVLFAVEALPLVFIIAFTAALIWSGWIGVTPTKLWPLQSAQYSKGWKAVQFIFATALLIGGAVCLLQVERSQTNVAEAVFWLMAAIVCLSLVAVVMNLPNVSNARRAALPLTAVVTLFFVFFLGMAISHSYVSAQNIDHQLQTADGIIQGKVIRSGERGVLFVDVIGHVVRFVRWSDIREVRTMRLTRPFQ
jgi:hypothetical protein